MPSEIPNLHSKILVAMSGGVDSCTAAAMLAEQGHDVVGITMRVVAGHEHASSVFPNRPQTHCLRLETIQHVTLRSGKRVAGHRRSCCPFWSFDKSSSTNSAFDAPRLSHLL